jgi:ATP-dependent Clp protease ATP-binding subunit ClpA
VFERFTDRARHVLVLAQEEARALGHDHIGTEHILLGLMKEDEGLAAKALESLDISLEAVRDKVADRIGPAEAIAPNVSPPFTPRSKKVLELSLREALQLGHNYIGTEHILLGLVREGEGVAAGVLLSLGADLAAVREQVVQLLSGYPGSEPAATRVARQAFRGEAPRCPFCEVGLTDRVRHRTLRSRPAPPPGDSFDVAREDAPQDVVAGLEVDAEETLPVVFVYCERCGKVLGILSQP